MGRVKGIAKAEWSPGELCRLLTTARSYLEVTSTASQVPSNSPPPKSLSGTQNCLTTEDGCNTRYGVAPQLCYQMRLPVDSFYVCLYLHYQQPTRQPRHQPPRFSTPRELLEKLPQIHRMTRECRFWYSAFGRIWIPP